ncbi:hypothetical protein [Micromonospora rubida]|uniref:hypothetical protein n=1 Tax=Micromonospora rubida TaxID=2697657 RepID=UPI0013768432|nr:hypothetical protein [Micromonospora rubida]NBE82041.1 hypothetical protein [Micromonospora rubida]
MLAVRLRVVRRGALVGGVLLFGVLAALAPVVDAPPPPPPAARRRRRGTAGVRFGLVLAAVLAVGGLGLTRAAGGKRRLVPLGRERCVQPRPVGEAGRSRTW